MIGVIALCISVLALLLSCWSVYYSHKNKKRIEVKGAKVIHLTTERENRIMDRLS